MSGELIGGTAVLLERLFGKTPWLTRARRRIEGAQRLGHYELLHPLGAGGMAEVFKARAIGPAGFERDVVVKRILPAYGRDEDFVRMFTDEARILGLIHHPNVVQAFEFGEDDGTLYLALEYVEGPSLSRILRALRAANRRMPPAIAAYIGREICRALDCVHRLEDENGARLEVVHRDVTPSNMIVTPWGGVKLLDFGVAKFTSAARSTRAGTVKGKPAYLAPEQLEGKPIDGRVDLFALGIVMHEMLSLQHLFAGESDLHTAKKIMEMKIPGPHRSPTRRPRGAGADRDARARARSTQSLLDGRRDGARPRRLRGRFAAAPRRGGGIRSRDRGDLTAGATGISSRAPCTSIASPRPQSRRRSRRSRIALSGCACGGCGLLVRTWPLPSDSRSPRSDSGPRSACGSAPRPHRSRSPCRRAQRSVAGARPRQRRSS